MWSSDHPVPPPVPVFSVCLNVHDTIGCSFAPGPHLTAGVATLASVPSLCGTDRLRSSHIILPRAGCQNERKHIGGLSSGSGRQSRWGVFTAWSRRLTAATETPAIRSTVSGYLSQCPSPSTHSRAVQTITGSITGISQCFSLRGRSSARWGQMWHRTTKTLVLSLLIVTEGSESTEYGKARGRGPVPSLPKHLEHWRRVSIRRSSYDSEY